MESDDREKDKEDAKGYAAMSAGAFFLVKLWRGYEAAADMQVDFLIIILTQCALVALVVGILSYSVRRAARTYLRAKPSPTSKRTQISVTKPR